MVWTDGPSDQYRECIISGASEKLPKEMDQHAFVIKKACRRGATDVHGSYNSVKRLGVCHSQEHKLHCLALDYRLVSFMVLRVGCWRPVSQGQSH